MPNQDVSASEVVFSLQEAQRGEDVGDVVGVFSLAEEVGGGFWVGGLGVGGVGGEAVIQGYVAGDEGVRGSGMAGRRGRGRGGCVVEEVGEGRQEGVSGRDGGVTPGAAVDVDEPDFLVVVRSLSLGLGVSGW